MADGLAYEALGRQRIGCSKRCGHGSTKLKGIAVTSVIANRSIRGKLMWITMLTSTGAVVLACLAFGLYELLNYRRQMSRDLSVLSEMISEEQAAGRDISDPKVAKEVNSWASKQRPIVLACVYGKDGKLLIKY